MCVYMSVYMCVYMYVCVYVYVFNGNYSFFSFSPSIKSLVYMFIIYNIVLANEYII